MSMSAAKFFRSQVKNNCVGIKVMLIYIVLCWSSLWLMSDDQELSSSDYATIQAVAQTHGAWLYSTQGFLTLAFLRNVTKHLSPALYLICLVFLVRQVSECCNVINLSNESTITRKSLKILLQYFLQMMIHIKWWYEYVTSTRYINTSSISFMCLKLRAFYISPLSVWMSELKINKWPLLALSLLWTRLCPLKGCVVWAQVVIAIAKCTRILVIWGFEVKHCQLFLKLHLI